MTNALSCRDVTRRFGEVTALSGICLDVEPGEIYGIIGPNGAGKTTLLNCIEVLGKHPVRDQHALTRRVGVQLQSAALPPRITVKEALELYSALHEKPQPWRELLTVLGIGNKARDRVERLSGGERQRVFIALALIHRPELVFLDELTTALDPQARRDMWQTIASIRDDGATVVLTTHYMEEAEHLCDRVAIIDRGHIVALDTVPALIEAHAGGQRITIELRQPPPADLDLSTLTGVDHVDIHGSTLTIHGAHDILQPVMTELTARELTVTDARTTSPGLEDVFLTLTGRRIGKDGAAA